MCECVGEHISGNRLFKATHIKLSTFAEHKYNKPRHNLKTQANKLTQI